MSIARQIRQSAAYQYAAKVKRHWVEAHRERIARVLLKMPPQAVPEPSTSQTSIHLLTSRRDWLGALWSARTFLHQAGRDFPIVFHEDGTLPAEAGKHLQESLPGAVVWSLADASRAVIPRLDKYPHCAQARTRHPTVLKLFDIPLLTTGERFLMLDSDLLFFAPPTRIMDWIDEKPRLNLWNRDIISAYNVTVAQAQQWYGIKLQEFLNSGLGAVCLDSMDLDLAEDFLARDSAWEILHRAEQTTLALLSSRFGTRLLPQEYLIDTNRTVGLPAGVVAKHYVGKIRDLFFSEGIQQLRAQGFIPGLR